MPGHIKLTLSGQPDPDPTEFLLPSTDINRDQQVYYTQVGTTILGSVLGIVVMAFGYLAYMHRQTLFRLVKKTPLDLESGVTPSGEDTQLEEMDKPKSEKSGSVVAPTS